MQALVFIKQVPQQNSVRITPDKRIDASGIEPIISLFDEYALEEALLQVERHGGRVTVATIGGEADQESLRKALAMGADEAVLLSDPLFTTVDALGAARIGSALANKLGGLDLILCGKQSTDEETAVFGPALARYLDMPVLTYVFKVHQVDPSAGRIVVDRALEAVIETVETTLPAVLTAVKDLNQPRYPSLLKIRKAAKAEIHIYNAAELGLTAEALAPQVEYLDRAPARPRPRGEMIEGSSAADKARRLVERLVEAQVI